jgi:protocatechuate 3,4-dioxygenase beta subunit
MTVRMRMQIWIVLVAAAIAALGAVAVNAAPTCLPTPKAQVTNYPGASHIPTVNNLLLPAGKSIEAEAQKLIILGRLVDSECKPVPEAVVEIWQLNPFGKWQLAEGADLVTPSPAFTGAGRAVTDSDGNFSFTTGFPGVTSRRVWVQRQPITIYNAPRINLRIKARGFPTFTTMLYFDSDRRNPEDPTFKRLKPDAQQAVIMNMTQDGDGTLTATKEIVLQGKAPYRSY